MPGSNGRRAQDKAEDKDRGQGALENTDWTSAPRWPIWLPKTQLSETESCLCPLQIFSFSLRSQVQYNPVGLPLWLSWWRIRLQCGRSGFNPWIEISPGEGKGYPLQYSGLENSMDCIVHGVTKSWTRLSDFDFIFHFVCICITDSLCYIPETNTTL